MLTVQWRCSAPVSLPASLQLEHNVTSMSCREADRRHSKRAKRGRAAHTKAKFPHQIHSSLGVARGATSQHRREQVPPISLQSQIGTESYYLVGCRMWLMVWVQAPPSMVTYLFILRTLWPYPFAQGLARGWPPENFPHSSQHVLPSPWNCTSHSIRAG